MSGTSLDGVDGVLADFSESKCKVAHYQSASLAPELRAELLALNTPGTNELHRAALAGNALAGVYAKRYGTGRKPLMAPATPCS